MTLRTILAAALGLALAVGIPAPARGGPMVAIAAAGDLRGVLDDLKAGFEGRHPGVQLQLTFGASGALTAQLQQGAPFDLFLSADTGFPESLEKAGLVSAEGVFPYATGRLVLWVRKDLNLDPAREGLKVLLHPAVRKVATANPRLAPYGRAGEAALRRAGLFEAVQPRLVFGENILQAAQFLQSGAAEAGLISHAQAATPALTGSGVTWTVPVDAYPPIRQAGVILKRAASPDAARTFRAYLLGPEGQAVLARHGFGKP